MGLTMGDKEATQLHALLSVCELKNGCAVTYHQQILKDVVYHG